MTKRVLLPLLVLIVIVFPACQRKVDNSVYVNALRGVITGTPQWVDRSALGKRLWSIERAFYEQRQFAPGWVDGDEPTPQMVDLISQLRYSEKHGLDPVSYRVNEFEAAQKAAQTKTGTHFTIDAVPEMDAKMTYAYLRYAADLLGWTHSAHDVYENWLVPPKTEDLRARLETAISMKQVRQSLEELAPTHPQYKGLQAALAAEREHPDGHVDQLKMNLERWRWAPRDLGDRYVLVNVPAYQMQVLEHDRPVLAMRVIVGAKVTPTPLFSDDMTYVVFSPYWNIPESIIKKETLPHMVKDPAYLERNHIEVVGTSGREPIDPNGVDWADESAVEKLHFRQEPGPENALGLVKFIFPNHFNVYMHDTPNDRLFFKPQRGLSHGCIRLEKPVELARYVLRDRPEWTEQRIDVAMHGKSEQAVTLKHRIPVHIGYWTAWVEPDGKTVTYTDDPYGIDAAHARLLHHESPRPVKKSPTPAAA